MKKTVLVIVALVVAFGIYVRVAPFDLATWHTDPIEAPEKRKGGYKSTLVLESSNAQSALEQVVSVAAEWPRTRILFGSPAEGRVSFVTRTRLWGFPDVTTVSAVAEGQSVTLTFYARLRFGGDDHGVNRGRVSAWIAQLQDQSSTSK